MNTVYVIKSSVGTREEVQEVARALNKLAGISKWNFDMQDCDRILRVEADGLDLIKLGNVMGLLGFSCEELPDD